MHRLEFGNGREGKLRAACDRCHDLKNRCLRTGGPDSRCDRCERLDIDCVYRNTSRIGRPRTQRRQSSVSQPQPSIIPDNSGFQDDTREPHGGHRRVPTEIDTSANTALIESPSDVMSLLVSPEVVHQPDMGWNLDFSNHIHSNFVSDPLLHHESSRLLPAQSHGSPEGFSTPESGSVGAAATTFNAEKTTDKLLQLQGQLHRLLWAANKETSADMVEESLEVIKTFLEILQAALAAQGRLPPDSGARNPPRATTGWPVGNMAPTNTEIHVATDGPTSSHQQTSAPGISYITAQQAMTCYSYILLTVDAIVGAVTSRDYGSGVTSTTASNTSTASASPSASLSLGFFSLASQPALNAEIVLHLALRMVQRLRVLIQVFVSGCKDLTERSMTPSPSSESLSGNTVVDGSCRKGSNSTAASISVTSHAVADLVSERERLLVEKLSGLTGGL